MSETTVNISEKKAPPTTKEFLQRYRALGLPGAKRFRRRTRLEEASHRDAVNGAYVKALIHELSVLRGALAEIRKEENWTVKGEDVAWVGESDPLEIIRKAEEALKA